MCAASSAVCHVCIFGHDTSGCARNKAILQPNIEHHRSYRCVELEVLAIRSLGDVQVSQEEALYGGSQHVFDCVDGISEQGKEMNDYCVIYRSE